MGAHPGPEKGIPLRTSILSLTLVIVLAGLLAGCASYSETRSDTFPSLWQVENGQWQPLADGGLQGGCETGSSGCRGDWASINGRVPLPANYRLGTTLTLQDGVLAELMLDRTAQRYTRVYLYRIENKLAIGNGRSTADKAYGGKNVAKVPFQVETNRPYRVEITVCNRNLSVSIDGKRYLSGEPHDTRQRGSLGLAVNGRARFDALRVTALNRDECAPGDRFSHPEGMPMPAPFFVFSE